MSVKRDISWFCGEAITLVDTISTDITGWHFLFHLALRKGGDELITKTSGSGISITDATNGVLAVAISRTDTTDLDPGVYYYEIARTDSGGEAVLTYGTVTLRSRA